jgi:hypothetical protein
MIIAGIISTESEAKEIESITKYYLVGMKARTIATQIKR